MRIPYVAAICPVYRQTKFLGSSIECWLRQTYPESHRELLILDDTGELKDEQASEGFNRFGRKLWRIKSTQERFDSIPDKYSYLLNECKQADVVCVWDAFDLYMPWHIQSIAMVCPMVGYVAPDEMISAYPGAAGTETSAGKIHGALGISRFLLDTLGGWPRTTMGDYEARMNTALHEHGVRVKPQAVNGPSYIYRWAARQTYIGKSLGKAISSPFWYEDVSRRTSPEGRPGSIVVKPGLDAEAESIFKSLGVVSVS